MCSRHTSEKRLIMRSECLRRIRNARQQRFLYVSNVLLSCRNKVDQLNDKNIIHISCTCPPMTHTKSGVRTNGAHSLLKPCVNERKEMTLFSTGYRLHQYHNVFNVSKEMAKVNVEEIA